ncbi:MAG: LamG domain-containing protein [Patescibacteria group bacterium]
MKENFPNSFLRDESGQSLMEIIVSLSIGAVLIGTASFGIAFMLRSTSTNQNLGTASQVTQGLLNNVQTFANSEWQNIYGLSKGSSNQYFLVASGTSYFAVAGREGLLSNDVTSNLIAKWGFDEDAASTSTLTYDMSGNNNIGTLTNGPTRTNSTCRVGNCLSFDGIDDHVNLGTPTIDNFNTADFTLSGWVKTTSTVGAVSANQNSGSSAGFTFQLSSGAMYFRTSDAVGNWSETTGVTPVNDNNWHYLVATRSGTTQAIYIDGKLDASNTVTLRDMGTGNTLYIGIYRPSPVDSPFLGLLDDIRIYNRALSAAEVQQIYNSQSFARDFYVLNVCRTNDSLADISTSTISSCPGGTADDPLTQEIVATTQWIFGASADQVSLSRFVTRWGNFSIRQTDWIGGSGQTGPITSPNSQFSSSTNIVSTSTFGSFQIQNLTQQ